MWTLGLMNPILYGLGQRAGCGGFCGRFYPGEDGFIKEMPGPAKRWTEQRDFPKAGGGEFS